jgi:hypothetical protein
MDPWFHLLYVTNNSIEFRQNCVRYRGSRALPVARAGRDEPVFSPSLTEPQTLSVAKPCLVT